MRNIYLMISLILICVSSASAIDESVAYTAEPVNQWILTLTGSQFEVQKAEIRKNRDSLNISASIKDIDAVDLISALAELENGEISASRLHPYGVDQSVSESAGIAKDKISELKSELAVVNDKEQILEVELVQLTQNLRKQAGLEEVDTIYKKIEEIDKKIALLK